MLICGSPSLRASGTLPSEAIQGEGLPGLDCFAANSNYVVTATTLPPSRNDKNGTRRFQNTTFSIFNSPLSIRPKGAPDCFAAKSLFKNPARRNPPL
ncbi:MAG: hypothetical protein LBT00_09875 [Spirochaetaceae bacterium]|nr:hypothetical protein [Spirochaetaceae bacterium]